MIDLDALLNSYKDVVDAHLANEPLLNAETYRSPDFVHQTNDTGHIYVGCVGKWLLAKGALVRVLGDGTLSRFDSRTAHALSAKMVSIQSLEGKLSVDNVAEQMRPFVVAYVRDSNAYSSDYIEINVVAKLKRDMSEVADDTETYSKTSAAIDHRFQAYASGNPDWAKTAVNYEKTELTDLERQPSGWVEAFNKSAQYGALPEKFRRVELNRFWALVDYSPEIANRDVVAQLLSTFNKSADTSVQQSVFNALAAMPFALVMTEVFSTATTLEKSGWLADILGSWHADFNEEQTAVIKEVLATASVDSRDAIYRAARLPDYQRSKWALQIQQLSSQP